MPAIVDRIQALEAAARLVQRGDLDRALKAYVQLFEQDRRDWNVANTLGDLYVRVGKPREGVAHFTTLAEQLAADGFAAKARALYRKILRIQPDNDVAKQRVDELDRQQGGPVSPFLKRVLETARATREASPAEEPAPPAALPPAPAPVPPPRLEIPAAPAVEAIRPQPDPDWPTTSADWADEWAAAGVARKAQPLREATPAPEVHEPRPQTEEDAVRKMLGDATMATRRNDFRAAFNIVEQFVASHPNHVLALETLVDIGVDAGFDAELQSAQTRLARACVEAGRYQQAWEAAVDLVVRHPKDARYRELLGRIDSAGRSHGHTFPSVPELEVEAAPPPPAPAVVVTAVAAPAPPPPARAAVAPVPAPAATPIPQPAPAAVAPIAPVPVERAQPDIAAAHADAPATADDLLREWADMELAFDSIRNGLLDDAAAAAEERLAEATRFMQARRTDDAIQALEEAMCAPHLRTSAGARLAQIYRDANAPLDALACLEWVAQIPPATEDNGHELAYELAVTLEALGQEAQALGVYRELITEVGSGYRDIAARLEKLAAA